jgi:anthranilate phosphoribosyltransferase
VISQLQRNPLAAALERLQRGSLDLGYVGSRSAFDYIMGGSGDADRISMLLRALRRRGETLAEFRAALDSVAAYRKRLQISRDAIDIGGTGGDIGATFNVSTTAALIVASLGVLVVKHGSRAISGKCGSIDIVEALGLPLTTSQAELTRRASTHRIAFLNSGDFLNYPASLKDARRALGSPSIFNLVGPCSHPAALRRQVIGVTHARDLSLIASVMKAKEPEHVLLVRGTGDRSDEFSVGGSTEIIDIKATDIRRYQVSPADFGMETASPSDIAGGDIPSNLNCVKRVLDGKDRGAARSVALMTASAGLYVAGLCPTIFEGIGMTAGAIDSGSALSFIDGAKASDSAVSHPADASYVL